MNKDKILGLLKPYFEQRDDVLMAFLFGSWAFDKQCHESDVDIAVYFRPEDGRLELEDSEAIFESEADIWREIEEMLEREGGSSDPEPSSTKHCRECYQRHSYRNQGQGLVYRFHASCYLRGDGL